MQRNEPAPPSNLHPLEAKPLMHCLIPGTFVPGSSQGQPDQTIDVYVPLSCLRHLTLVIVSISLWNPLHSTSPLQIMFDNQLGVPLLFKGA